MTAKTLWKAGVCACALVTAGQAFAAPARHHRTRSPGVAELAAQLQALQQSNAALQAKVERLVLEVDAAKDMAHGAENRAALANNDAAETRRDEAAVINTLPAKVAAAVEAAKPKTDKLYYKGLSLTLGGYLDLTGIYRSRSQLADDTSSFSKIPFANSVLNHQDESRLSGRGSRVSLKAEGDVSKTIHVTGYGEVDFLGAAQTANNNETSSYNPRIRQGWLNVDFNDLGLSLLAGDGWSLATLNTSGIKPLGEAIPNVLEYSYMPGFVYARQGELRLTERFGNGLTLAVAAENPATLAGGAAPTKDASGNPLTITASAPGGVAYNVANNYTLHSIPDLIVKGAWDGKLTEGRNLHLEAFYLYRQYQDQVLTNPTLATASLAKHTADSGAFGVGIYANLIPRVLDLQANAITGEGIGRYAASTLSDVTYGADGGLTPLKETAWMTGLTWHASPQWDVYAYAGAEELSGRSGLDGAGKAFGYGSAFYNNAQCASIAPIAGAACTANIKRVAQESLGFWRKLYVGNFGRVQYGAAWSYTKQEAFAGVGGAPSVDENILMTSIRYYPF